MSEFEIAIFDRLFSVGGNAAVIALAFIAWKLDRRILKLETIIEKWIMDHGL